MDKKTESWKNVMSLDMKPSFTDYTFTYLDNYINFQSLPEEYWEVWHRMNAGTSWLEGYKNHLKNHPAGEKKGLEFKNENSHKLWKYVDNYKEEA